jgi:hypothetical protein
MRSANVLMARQFKPVRFFVLVAIVAFVTCGVTAFYTKRAAYGRTPDERAGYAIGATAGGAAPPNAKLPTAAALNTMAQTFQARGIGRSRGLRARFRTGIRGSIQENSSAMIGRHARMLLPAL